eukprot:TRINITY_DN3586_c0_g2_i1.p1 TRINITY_DN3586_c0_g2~~TRINITY_DN3586_c0_g2_i1.p1  ORF type:complete len:325 (-),score=32.24 TRINITY_DN3586_c0_g2_i1:92-1066(-)
MSRNYLIDPSRLNCPSDALNCTECISRYNGEYCENDVLDQPHVMFLAVLIQVVCSVIIAVIFIWSFYGLYHRIHLEKRKWTSLSYISVYLLNISGVVRIFGLVDPYALYLIYDYTVQNMLLWSGMMLVIGAVVLTITVWTEVVMSVKSARIDKKMRIPKIITISISIFLFLGYIISVIYGIATSRWINAILYLGIISSIVIVLSIFIIGFSLPVISKVKRDLPPGKKRDKIRRMQTNLIYSFIVGCSMVIASIIVQVTRRIYVPNDSDYITVTLIMHLIVRIQELLAVVSVFIFIFDWIPYTPQVISKTHNSTVQTDHTGTLWK